MSDRNTLRIEGYAIVSEDGMLADAARVMPGAMIFDADQRFFEQGLDGVDVVVHGRHSQDRQARSPLRRRIVLTRSVPAIAPHSSNPRAVLWNPSGALLEQVLAEMGLAGASVGVIGGAEAFDVFLNRFSVFYLTRAPGVWLPGGRPVFLEVPGRTPENVLAAHGLRPDAPAVLDAAQNLTVVAWRR